MTSDEELNDGDHNNSDPMAQWEIEDLLAFLKEGFERGETDYELAEEMKTYAANKEHLISVIRYLNNKKQ